MTSAQPAWVGQLISSEPDGLKPTIVILEALLGGSTPTPPPKMPLGFEFEKFVSGAQKKIQSGPEGVKAVADIAATLKTALVTHEKLSTYYDKPKAFSLADEGMALADANATDAHKKAGRAAIETVARRQQYFTTEDIWVEVLKIDTTVDPKQGSFLGPLMASAAKEGLMRRAKHAPPPSQRPANHGRILRIWESCICPGVVLAAESEAAAPSVAIIKSVLERLKALEADAELQTFRAWLETFK